MPQLQKPRIYSSPTVRTMVEATWEMLKANISNDLSFLSQNLKVEDSTNAT